MNHIFIFIYKKCNKILCEVYNQRRWQKNTLTTKGKMRFFKIKKVESDNTSDFQNQQLFYFLIQIPFSKVEIHHFIIAF
jgi:hypothetical protein